MKAQWGWRAFAGIGLVVGLFLVASEWTVPSAAEAASCQGGAPAPCAEDPAIDNCVQCHSMGITGGNRNGTDRIINVSSASNRHILGPPMASWLSTVQGMISKGGGGNAARTAAYLDTNYCPTCTGPILSSPTISDIQSDRFTISWITSGSDFGDLAATSCVVYGTSLGSMTGDTCNPSDPSYDPDSGNLVTNHSVTVTGLTGLTQYYVVHRSVAGGQTATYAAAATLTTLPGGGPPGPSELGTIVSLTVGNYNGDSHLDIGVGVSTKNHVIAYLGNGAGGFTVGPTLASVGTTPSAITSGGVQGDFNEDGMDDLAVANFGAASRNIAVFFGTSPSGFQTTAVSNVPLSDPPTGVVTGDFNGDGVLDLAVATVQLDGALGHLLIFLGQNDGAGHGTGHFTGPVNSYDIQISTVASPTVTSVVPSPIDCTGLPTTVTINGTLLLSSATVTLDGVTPLTIVSGSPDNTSLTVEVPVGVSEGSHSVVVTLGSLPPASGTLVITPRAVAVGSVSPSSRIYGVDPSAQVSITGSGFTVGATVTIGSLSGTTVAGSSASVGVPFVTVNSSLIRVWVPNTALATGSHDVSVANNDSCGGEATLFDGFTVAAAQPTVSSLSSPSVTYGVTPSQSITISGANFVSGAVISVGGLTGATVPGSTATPAAPFVYVSSTQLRLYWTNTSVSPGSYAVDVTNPGAAGGLTGSLAGGFTVTSPQPTVTSASPNSVTYGVSANQSVTVTGTNFVLGATITVGGLSGTTVAGSTASIAVPFVYVSSTTLRFYWGNTSLPLGSFSVQVSNPAASGGLTGALAGGFQVLSAQPTITSVSPNSVTYGITPSSSVSIIGSNFVLGATITVGSLSGATVSGSSASVAVPYVWVSNSQIRFWWPNTSLSPGAYGVQVTNPAEAGGLQTTLAGGFTVVAPQPSVTNLTPNSVTYGVTPSSSISVLGSNFVLGAQITIGSLSGQTVSGSTATIATPYVYVSSGQLRFYWPNTDLAPGVYAIQITNPSAGGGLSTTLASALTVVAPQPTVTSASPASVVYGVTPSSQVTIVGTNFVTGATVTINALSGSTVNGSSASAFNPFVHVSSGQIRVWWPNTSLAPGTYNVTVTNPTAAGELSATLVGGFVVTAPSPTISGVTPATVTFGGPSQQITITGSNFVEGATITVGSLSGATISFSSASPSVPFAWLSSGQLRFWWPSTSLPAGTYDVIVMNPSAAGGLTTTLTGGFVVQ